ncbi:DUF7835 family putative zinc beta-ribbon protein [Halegenticoccus soli]|uniref:DUF7835 family putative zinc beta-ribbon protein n=1 Tax=Halegenticoccus soli TaxID=1985678 RepID=UPI000C6EAF81|nr:hypothetical protein [Halegenticoccus soli]
MDSFDLQPDEAVSYCQHCGRETVHRIEIALRETTTRDEVAPENAKHARKPVRTALCEACGAKSHQSRFHGD